MTLKGDLREINLADIFQTLGMNQQEGTLTVFSETKRTNIYFGQEGIRLLTSDKQKYPRLGEILVRRHKISATLLQEALEKQKESGALLGEILIFQGTVTEKEIEVSVRSQIEEIIYDVFSWKDAKFEFIAGEPLEEFFDQTATGRKITFNISGIIMEAARRIDEWDLIHEVIPGMPSIYASAVDSPTFDPAQADYPQKMILEVMVLVDGMRSVEEICNESPYSSFETSKIIAFLIKEKQLRPLTVEELMAAGFRLREEGRLDDSVAIYRGVVEKNPTHVAAREALAEIFARLGRTREAGDEFAELGKLARDAGDEDKAFGYLEKSADLSPKNFEMHRQLLDIYLAKGRLEEAGKEAVLVAKAYWQLGKQNEARRVLDLLLKGHSRHIECRQLLVNILIEINDKAGIVRNYEALALEYGSRNDMVKVRQIYEKILNIDPHRRDLKSKLESLKDPHARRRRMPGWAKSLIILFFLAILLAGGGAAWVYWNDKAEKDFTELSRKLEQRLDLAAKKADENDDPLLLQEALDEARAELDELKHRYRWSKLVLIETRIGRKRTQFETEARKKKTVIEERLSNAKGANDKLNRDAVRLYEMGKYEEALSKYRKVDLQYLPELGHDVIKQRIKEIDEYLTKAKTAYSDLTEFESEIKKATDKTTRLRYIKAAFEAAQRLSRYHCSAERRLVRFPLYLETQPPGASVVMGGTPHGEPTPTMIRYGIDSPAIEVRIEKASFNPHVFKLTPKSLSLRADGWHHSITLGKKQAWKFAGKARMVSGPVAYGSVAVIGDLDGKLYFIGTVDGKEIWHFDPKEALAEFYAAPCIVSNRAYIPGTNRCCYGIDLVTRLGVWKQELPAPVRHTPAFGGGKLYVATERSLHALDADADGKIQWSAEIKTAGRKSAVTTPPVLIGKHVLVGTSDGRICVFSAADGNSSWVHTLPAGVAGPIAALGNLALVACGDGKLYALDPGAKKVAWDFKVGNSARDGASTLLVVLESRVFFGTGDGRLLCLDVKAKPVRKWWHQLRASPVAAPVVSGDTIYAFLSDGTINAITLPGEEKNPSFEVKWEFSFPPDAEIIGAAIVHKTLVVALKNGALYAFEE